MALPILCIFGEMGAVLPLETEDQLEQALYNRQVIEYASQDAATPTALPSPSPIPQSHLFLQESAGGVLLAAVPRPESSRAHPSCFYDLGATDYPSDPFPNYYYSPIIYISTLNISITQFPLVQNESQFRLQHL